MTARISAAQPPFPQAVEDRLGKRMKGRPSLVLFTTLARDPRLFERFFVGGMLDRGNLTMRTREIVIDRICALSKSEYEWGVHVTFFAERVGLTEEQIVSTVKGGAADSCWNAGEKALIAACDQLHETSDMDDATWANLKAHFSEEAILEILMLAGKYKMVSFLTNALRLPLEDAARRFPL